MTVDLDALYQLTHGLYVLGARDGDRFVGSTVDAVMQVANKPLVIALSCNNGSYTKDCIEKSGEFSLSVLGKNVDPFAVANFGFQTSRKVDKWEKVDYYVNNNLPFLRDNIAELHCKVLQKVVFESNTLFIAEVQNCSRTSDGEPLTYFDYRSFFKKDVMESFEKFIKNTPTEEKKGKIMAETNKKWVCTVCGYVYDGEIPFEELPDDYVCPLCGVGKDMFELQEV